MLTQSAGACDDVMLGWKPPPWWYAADDSGGSGGTGLDDGGPSPGGGGPSPGGGGGRPAGKTGYGRLPRPAGYPAPMPPAADSAAAANGRTWGGESWRPPDMSAWRNLS